MKTRTLEELIGALNIDKSFVSDRWERFKNKANGFHVNYLNWVQNHLTIEPFEPFEFAFSAQKEIFLSNCNWR